MDLDALFIRVRKLEERVSALESGRSIDTAPASDGGPAKSEEPASDKAEEPAQEAPKPEATQD